METNHRLDQTESRIPVRRRRARRERGLLQPKKLGALVGASRPMQEIYGLIKTAAPTPASVLISGECGTGKKLAARTIHDCSARKGAFITFNAAAMDVERGALELLGRCASGQAGLFRKAHRGTLYIEHVEALPLELQARLLRVLENREVLPLGATVPHRVDVRVIASSQKKLEEIAHDRSFRTNLYYRLAIISMTLPPLRRVRKDIPLLVRHYLDETCLEHRLSREAFKTLQAYSWPGNVQQLWNVLERATLFCKGKEIGVADLGLPH